MKICAKWPLFGRIVAFSIHIYIFEIEELSLLLRHTSPEDSRLLRYSRNASSFISLSVKIKVMPLPSAPATLYKAFKSSIRLFTL